MVDLYIQVGDFKALFFQLIQGVQHSVMLKSGGNDVFFTLFRTETGSGENRLVIGLAAAGGEVDFPGLAAQTSGDFFPGSFQCFFGFLTGGMKTGGICVNIVKIWQHGINCHTAHFCCSGIVCVYLHMINLL